MLALNPQLGAALPCALASCALVFAFTGGDASANPASRLATMDALVHERAFEIDQSVFGDTVDKVRIGDHFYSSKPPLLSVGGALIYKVLKHWTPISFRKDRTYAVQVMSVILAGIPHVLLLGYAEALTVGSALCLMLGFYTLTTKNYGGLCSGFRWFLPIVPLALVFVADWLSNVRYRAAFALFFLLMLVGQYHAFAALPHPWEISSWDRWLAS
jgi:uncharacterized membrane protein YjdF